MNNRTLLNILKSIIWLGLVVIIFSPLYLSPRLFFPFIVTKTIAFNVAVEIMFLAYLILAWRQPAYRLRLNLVTILMAIYLAIIFVSSLLGNDFYRSFWSNNERSEGILLLLHLFLFLMVLTSFFRRFKDWLYVFDLSFLAGFIVSLYALGQFFQVSFLPASTGGARLTATIGNAGYMAGYLIFAIFFGLLLLFKRQNIYLKIYYFFGITLNIFIVIFTETRGGWLALFLGGLLFGLYLCFFYFKSRWLKAAGAALIILGLVLPFVLMLNKNSQWVTNNRILNRVASISPESTTAQNRFMTWGSAWAGFRERPILGWGYENFYQPFDKYFNPKIKDVVWYDRAHNIIFDRLLTGGLLGLSFYLSLLFWPVLWLWRNYQKKEGNNRKYFVPLTFTLVVIAYFIQNLFIFEALVTYVPLFLVLAFIGLFGPHYDWPFLKNKNFKLISLSAYLLISLLALYFINFKPVQANLKVVRALSDSAASAPARVDLFKEALALNTYGNQEYRRQLANLFENMAMSNYPDKNFLARFAQQVEMETIKQTAENPHSVINYLLAMRFNNLIFNLSGAVEYLNKNINLFERAAKLSATRQQIYFEIGYTNLAFANYFKLKKEAETAQKYYNLAIKDMEKAVSLDSADLESHRQLLTVLIFAGKNERVKEIIKTKSPDKETKINFLRGAINIANRAKNEKLAQDLSQELSAIEPK